MGIHTPTNNASLDHLELVIIMTHMLKKNKKVHTESETGENIAQGHKFSAGCGKSTSGSESVPVPRLILMWLSEWAKHCMHEIAFPNSFRSQFIVHPTEQVCMVLLPGKTLQETTQHRWIVIVLGYVFRS